MECRLGGGDSPVRFVDECDFSFGITECGSHSQDSISAAQVNDLQRFERVRQMVESSNSPWGTLRRSSQASMWVLFRSFPENGCAIVHSLYPATRSYWPFMNGEKLSKKATYWVRSKQANEISGFSGRPVPAHFATLREAEMYRRRLNLHRGPYHPGYIVEEQDDSPPPFSAGIRTS